MTRSEPSLEEILGERQHLLNLAFRMLGTTHDAEDVVQETYSRWFRLRDSERSDIRVPQAWLTRVASRICLDILGSARARRESYVGEWLPEPVPERALASSSFTPDPLDRVSLDSDVSMALLVVLDSLTPAERVAFVLHDVFALSFDEIAEIVGRTPQACRKLASSARAHVRDRRARESSPDAHTRVVQEFWAACQTGDLDLLITMLDPDVVTRSDGGGKIRAALRPVLGPDRTARFVLGIIDKNVQNQLEPRVETVNGLTGVVFRRDGVVAVVVSVNVQDDKITDVWLTLNPDKLAYWVGR